MLSLLRSRIERLQEVCLTRHAGGEDYPTKGGDGGDDCLWMGLLSTVDVDIAKEGVLQSQSATGMFYRNPERRITKNEGHKAYFSRDMAMGVLCWLVSEDKLIARKSARAWLNFIDKSRPCLVKKPKLLGGGCLIRGFHSYAPDKDGRSRITPTMWSMMSYVWEHLDLEPHQCMSAFDSVDNYTSDIEASSCKLGYQLHLKAVQSYLKLLLGHDKQFRREVAQVCFSRLPQNLFYKILFQEGATEQDIEQFLAMIPNPLTFEPKDYWLWEKGDYVDAVRDGKMCGWDIVFLGKLILKFS